SLVDLREAVADPVDREEISGTCRIGLELVPDVLHVRVDRPLVGLERDTVHRVEKLRSREDAARLARHGGDELELGRGQIHTAFADGRAHARYVEGDVPDANDLGL